MNRLLPVFIIALGILLLLGNLHVMSMYEIWLLLKTWWPVFLILWGLRMLTNKPTPPAPPKEPDA
jgi:hypothetical protein